MQKRGLGQGRPAAGADDHRQSRQAPSQALPLLPSGLGLPAPPQPMADRRAYCCPQRPGLDTSRPSAHLQPTQDPLSQASRRPPQRPKGGPKSQGPPLSGRQAPNGRDGALVLREEDREAEGPEAAWKYIRSAEVGAAPGWKWGTDHAGKVGDGRQAVPLALSTGVTESTRGRAGSPSWAVHGQPWTGKVS